MKELDSSPFRSGGDTNLNHLLNHFYYSTPPRQHDVPPEDMPQCRKEPGILKNEITELRHKDP